MEQTTKKREINPFLKLGLELGPTAVFFMAYFIFKRTQADADALLRATPFLMAAVLISLALSRHLMKHWPVMPLITAVLVAIFGSLTLWFQDQTFIKMKPTIINLLFGSTLLIGLAFGKSLLAFALDMMIELSEEGWKKLTLRWGLFFFFLALLNEVVWRTQTDDFWMSFRLFGTTPITILFAIAQTPLILKHEKKPVEKTEAD